MRGKVKAEQVAYLQQGITPAYAGKSTFSVLFWKVPRDHPRVCGEKLFNSSSVWSLTGSPPRMRGKGNPGSCICIRPGITPAYAGKSGFSPFLALWVEDHPRVCGEKKPRQLMQTSLRGSTPRMRGKGSVKLPRNAGSRITPAYAGKSSSHSQKGCLTEDHPRVCGEKTQAKH